MKQETISKIRNIFEFVKQTLDELLKIVNIFTILLCNIYGVICLVIFTWRKDYTFMLHYTIFTGAAFIMPYILTYFPQTINLLGKKYLSPKDENK